MKRRLTAYTLALGLLLPAAASAQYAEPPPPPQADPVRDGFFFGGGLGGGSLSLSGEMSEGEGEGLGSIFFELHFGGMVSPKAALLLELWGSDHTGEYCEGDLCYPEEGRVGQGNAGVAFQYWLTPRFWLKAGLGTSRLSARAFGETIEAAKGTAVLGAIGFELLHRKHYALDAQLRLTAAGYKKKFLGEYDQASSGAIGLSFTWY